MQHDLSCKEYCLVPRGLTKTTGDGWGVGGATVNDRQSEHIRFLKLASAGGFFSWLFPTNGILTLLCIREIQGQGQWDIKRLMQVHIWVSEFNHLEHVRPGDNF